MSPFQRKLAALSRDRQFLVRGALGILSASILLGFVAKKLFDQEETKEEKAERVIQKLIRYESDRDREELADMLAQRGAPTTGAIASYVRFVRVFIENNLVLHSGNPEAVKKYTPPLEFSTLPIEAGERSFESDEQQALFQLQLYLQ